MATRKNTTAPPSAPYPPPGPVGDLLAVEGMLDPVENRNRKGFRRRSI